MPELWLFSIFSIFLNLPKCLESSFLLYRRIHFCKVLFLFLIKSADGEKEDQFNGSPPRPQPRGPRTPPGPPPPDDDFFRGLQALTLVSRCQKLRGVVPRTPAHCFPDQSLCQAHGDVCTGQEWELPPSQTAGPLLSPQDQSGEGAGCKRLMESGISGKWTG